MNERQEAGIRRIKPRLIATLILIGIIVALAVMGYQKSRFPKDTFIDGVNCGGLTVKQSAQKIEESEVKIWLPNGEIHSATSKELGRSIKELSMIEACLDQKNSKDGKEIICFKLGKDAYEIDRQKMSDYLRSIPSLEPASMTESQNAYLERTSEGFIRIVPEVYGTKVSLNEVEDLAFEALVCGSSLIDLQTLISEPEIKQDNLVLISRMEKVNKILETTITYTLSDESEYVLDFEITKNWVYQDEDGMYDVNIEERIAEFVQVLDEKVQELGEFATVTTHNGTFTLPVEKVYRNSVDIEFEAKELFKEFLHGTSHSRKPYYKRYNDFSSENQVFIEITIGEQKIEMYGNGMEPLNAPCITGTKGTDDTPTGIFFSGFKARHYPLRKYSVVIVDPWITVEGNIGIHGADSWKSESDYTPDEYEKEGSHGCINVRDKVGLYIYDNIELGKTVIIIHD